MIAGASMVSKVPVTIKMRAGCSEDKNTALNTINLVIRPFTSKYVDAVTIHARSRAQNTNFVLVSQQEGGSINDDF